MKETVRLRLTITASYDLDGTSVEDVMDQLKFASEYLSDEGLLSGDLSATVSEWENNIEEVI
jgi:hypothetical protein